MTSFNTSSYVPPPTTSTTAALFGQTDHTSTTQQVHFEAKYRKWAIDVLSRTFGRNDITEDAFRKLVDNIIAKRGIRRNALNERYRFHTLLFNRGKRIFQHLLRDLKDSHKREFVAKTSPLNQPGRPVDEDEDKERLHAIVLKIALSLLSDDYKSTPYYSHFKNAQLVIWRTYISTGYDGTATARLTGASNSKVSRTKDKVHEQIIALAKNQLALEQERCTPRS